MTVPEPSTTVLKLGGSLITDKSTPETVDEPTLAAVLDAVAARRGGRTTDQDERGAAVGPAAGSEDSVGNDTGTRLVVVHGGGSFGHHHASAHGVTTTRGTSDPRAVADIHGAMKRLNGRVVDGLLDRGVPAVPVHPLSLAARDAEGTLTLPLSSVETFLEEGFVPVLHGDGVVHADHGVTVLSGDELVTSLADGLQADRVGVCSTVDGVLDDDGDVVPRIDAFDDVASVLGGAETTDVTGGMAGKVRTLLALESRAFVFGPDELEAFLDGSDVGTTIVGRD